MNTIKKFFYDNIMVLATLFFSGAFIAGKFSIAEFPVFSLTFFRFLIAGVLLLGVLILQKRQIFIPKKEIPYVIVLSLLGMVGYHLFFFSALKFTSSTNTSLIAATNPVFTTIFAYFFLKEKINKNTIVGILLSFIGVIFLITNGSLSILKNLSFNLGDILMLCAVLCFSVYFIILKNVLKRVDPFILTTYVFLVCALVLLPVVIYENPMTYLKNTTFLGWSSLLYMSIFSSVFAYLIQQISVQRIGPVKTSLYINLTPVFSTVLAWAILGEVITYQKLIATLIILSGVILTIKSKIK
nr:DMT family transporter [uncultured Cetobacterium sp.]